MSAAKSLSLLNSVEFLIRIEKGPDTGKVYRIFPPKIEIGRDTNLQIVLTDPKVSRKQCSILIKEDILLQDDSGKGTTLVNGERITKQALKPGDMITFGDTTLQFMARSVQKVPDKAQLKGQVGPTVDPEKQKRRKKFYMFAGVIAVLAGSLYMVEDPVPTIEEQLVTSEQLEKQIENSEEKQFELRETAKNNRNIDERRYLYSVEYHFIKGFRDLQTGQYGRALDAFGTTIATDGTHQRAQQYAKIARKKRIDLIDTHMSDGIKYKEKLMYDRCIAEFEKALVLINNKKTQKFRIAEAQLEECKLLKSGGF